MSLSRMTALWMLCHLWLKIESGKSILRILNCGLSAIPGIIPFNVLRRLSCRLPVYRIMCSSWISAKCAAFSSILKKRLLFQVSAVFAGVPKNGPCYHPDYEPAGGLMKSIRFVPIVRKGSHRRSVDYSLYKCKGGWEIMEMTQPVWIFFWHSAFHGTMWHSDNDKGLRG